MNTIFISGIVLGFLVSCVMIVFYMCISDNTREQLDEANDEIEKLNQQMDALSGLLTKIASHETATANATVKRMAHMAGGGIRK